MRRIALTVEQADDLENEVSSYIADHGYEAKHARRHLKQLGLAEEAVKGLLARIDEVLHMVTTIESEPSQRDLYETVVDAYERLDKYLNKQIRVIGKRRGSRKPFTFHVG